MRDREKGAEENDAARKREEDAELISDIEEENQCIT
jgi:hypothetical protein